MSSNDAVVRFAIDLEDDSKTEDSHNAQKKERRRSSISTETESVEVFIYRRTSMVTASSTGGNLMKLDQDIIPPHHNRIETGLNLWDNQQSNTLDDDYHDEFKQHKSRESTSIDNDASSVIYHESVTEFTEANTVIVHDDDDEDEEYDDVNEEIAANPIKTEQVHVHHEKTDYSKSTILEMTGTPYHSAAAAPNITASDEQFFIEMQMQNEVPLKNEEKAPKKKKTKKLTAQNLMVHDYKHSLHEMDDGVANIEDALSSSGLRYIELTDDENNEEIIEKFVKRDMMQKRDTIQKEQKPNNKMKLSTKIKYATAIGAICAVTLLIGVVIYSNSTRPRRSSFKPNVSSDVDVLIMPKTRRRPPRI